MHNNIFTATLKEVKYQRTTRDYDAYLDGRYIGSRETGMEAWELLDTTVYEMLTHQTMEVA